MPMCNKVIKRLYINFMQSYLLHLKISKKVIRSFCYRGIFTIAILAAREVL